MILESVSLDQPSSHSHEGDGYHSPAYRRMLQIHSQVADSAITSEQRLKATQQSIRHEMLEAELLKQAHLQAVLDRANRFDGVVTDVTRKINERSCHEVSQAKQKLEDHVRRQRHELDKHAEERAEFARHFEQSIHTNFSKFGKALAELHESTLRPRSTPRSRRPKPTAPRFVLADACPPPVRMLHTPPRSSAPRLLNPIEKRFQKKQFINDMMAPHDTYLQNSPLARKAHPR